MRNYWKSPTGSSHHFKEGEAMERTYVCRDWVPRNEITTPLKGTIIYRNCGIIKAVTKEQEKIQVGRITYEEFDNEEYQYIISPFWEIIDMLPTSVFQGIPGIDMDLRLEHYYRANCDPVFITERTPGKNREDLWELLDSVGLTYYDRLEWLIRTDLRAAVDNLIVERAREEACTTQVTDSRQLSKVLEESQYGDTVIISHLELLGKNSETCTKTLNRLMHYGVRLISRKEKIDICPEEYKAFLPMVEALCRMNERVRRERQQEGIEIAKEQKRYRGRVRKETDEAFLLETIRRFREKEIPLDEALRLTELSKSTFYRRMKEKA